ncbi:MAG TPA: FKBP-type peptidyl-prolyl cis-trans isomerase [Rhizomicrobium sp.]|nr:FKBP-type peptidyl-prolyl cis-trans isomerase [Rhizomicrobium sp.]
MRSFLLALTLLLAASFPVLAADEALSAAANAAYLADNAKTPGTVVRPSGLQYRALRHGTGKRPGGNDVVRLAYSIRLINGTLVDSTPPVLPATFAISSVGFAGLAEALSLMHAGDRWQLVIPSNLAFGGKGALNGAVPANQTLQMDVTLISAEPPRPGEAVSESPFSLWGNGRENGAALTIRP